MLIAYTQVNAFFTSKIKERIISINTAQSGNSKSYKYILLPLLVLTLSVLVGFQKIGPGLKPQTHLFYNQGTSDITMSTVPAVIANHKLKRHLNRNSITSAVVQPRPKDPLSSVFIDARTDTVKFSLVKDSVDRRFKGIYVIEDKILTDDEIRAKIRFDGRFEMKLASQPIIGTYSANDSSAVKKWGEQARYGVVFVKSRPEKPNQ
jgi:hypothetical protein